ncbi:MAG TPA: 2-succinyl-5-enolpyruvyl-6-hydroxy-3-cyclohexene-1-carboxylic-acid synthase [Pseudogracilibacillus sp.]|nr:2-succinyl-5-enolpyruvyl-6-hydroxy-3-cyclohexene-1-carboxylic-acid synthase [Pseudogracilibacillus sp.]
MKHTKSLTKYVGNFIDELAYNGVKHAVISPGSRSTPLAMMVTEHKQIKEWVLVDERSASFFALGLARATNEPVVLICTSGTAAANYYPAIVEAFMQRVPLIVLTADRPHELRDIGASQTINQIGMYGDFVKWFHEMALPEDSEPVLKYVRGKAARAVVEANGVGNQGPVHLNFPFREPLVPDLTVHDKWGKGFASYPRYMSGEKVLVDEMLDPLVKQMNQAERGLIVCGPQFDESLSEELVQLAQHLSIPILADPLSQLRAFDHDKTHLIEGYDAFLFSDDLKEELKPSYIIRFGAMPISKRYMQFVKSCPETIQFIVEDDSGVREASNEQSCFIYANSKRLLQDLKGLTKERHKSAWLKKWQAYNAVVMKHVNEIESTYITEGEAVRTLFEVVPNQSGLFIGNSMPIRDTDTFFTRTNKALKLYGNRGVSGIEGINSTMLGIAAAKLHDYHTLVIGDLSFYHDLTGLLASKKYNIPLTIVLINNDGGGIFSFLPQAEEGKHFETLFGTPLGIDFKHVADLYGATYECVKTNDHLKDALKRSYEEAGISIVEVKTNREENAAWHRHLWQKIQEEL